MTSASDIEATPLRSGEGQDRTDVAPGDHKSNVAPGDNESDVAPGDNESDGASTGEMVRRYLLGLGLALVLTGASFWAIGSHIIYGPAVPVAIMVLAVAQMGVHLVFFLHITSAPDNLNNILALAFGTLIVILVVAGSLWIMANLNHNMMPMDGSMQMP